MCVGATEVARVRLVNGGLSLSLSLTSIFMSNLEMITVEYYITKHVVRSSQKANIPCLV